MPNISLCSSATHMNFCSLYGFWIFYRTCGCGSGGLSHRIRSDHRQWLHNGAVRFFSLPYDDYANVVFV